MKHLQKGNSWTFSLRVNGATSSLSVTISDTETSNQNLTDIVQLAAGDKINYIITPSGTPTLPSRLRLSLVTFSTGSQLLANFFPAFES